jgi:hypothetical protein
MYMKKSLLPALYLLLCGCASNEIGNSKDVNPETIYTSYEISYTEGDDMVSCLARFRFAGKNGTTLVLNSPSNVQLDGVALPVDSSRLDGAFYYTKRKFDDFTGKHSFVFTGINGKTYPQPFTFKRVGLVANIPPTWGAGDMPLEFSGLEDGDLVHVQIQDTSSATEDISRVDTIKNGKILISSTDFGKLKSGMLNMDLYIDVDMPLQNATEEGGKLNLFYRMQRQRTILAK